MSPASTNQAPALLDRIMQATNAHDVDALTASFADDVDSRQPAHPQRDFQGAAQIRRNWTEIFGAIPDLSAELVRFAVEGTTVWAEWDWRGTRRDGEPHRMRGVTILGEDEGRAAWVRFYMEPVESAGPDIDAAIRRLTTSVAATR